MDRNGSDSSDDGRGEGTSRTPQGGNRRRHVSPDGTNVPPSSSHQNLSREERKIQVSLVCARAHDLRPMLLTKTISCAGHNAILCQD